jgi:serine/threonine protein kinase
MENAWDREAKVLEYIKDIDHPHIIKCIAAIRRGDKRYFMFPWADVGSLRDHWKSTGKRDPDVLTISQAITQLRGLADALDCLHNYKRPSNHGDPNEMRVDGSTIAILGGQINAELGERSPSVEVSTGDNICHGDLNPDNLLCFGGSASDFGTLKVADMGFAKRYLEKKPYYTHGDFPLRYRTYEAPEENPVFKLPTSQLHDMWSMGCITLEMIIWILYGNDVLEDFHKQLRRARVCQYYQRIHSEDETRPVVHPVVRQWIEHLKQYDPECSQGSAIGDLLETVENMLLVVPLPPIHAITMGRARSFAFPKDKIRPTGYRCTAAQFSNALDDIVKKMNQSPSYVLVGGDRQDIKRLSSKRA